MSNNKKILFKILRYLSLTFVTISGLITIIATGGDDDPQMNHYMFANAIVEEIEIIISESFPVEVDVIASGYIGTDGCWHINSVTTERENNIFYIDIESIKQKYPERACTLQMEPFEEVIPLDVDGLEAGVYEVDVNGVLGSFELYQDNI